MRAPRSGTRRQSTGPMRAGFLFRPGLVSSTAPVDDGSTARHDCAGEDCNRGEERCEQKPKRIADPVCVPAHGRFSRQCPRMSRVRAQTETDCSCNRFRSFLCSVSELAAYGRFWRPPPPASPRSRGCATEPRAASRPSGFDRMAQQAHDIQ